MSFTYDSLFLGQLPKRIVLGLVDNRAFNGDISLNPHKRSTLQFNLFNSSLGRTTSSVGPVATIIFRIEIYNCILHPIYWRGDIISSDTGNTIGREQFVNGHALYCFDLTPYLSISCGHHFSVTKSGNLRLELAFEVMLSITGNVLVYSEFDNVI